jgi:hypothetical protein
MKRTNERKRDEQNERKRDEQNERQPTSTKTGKAKKKDQVMPNTREQVL